MASSSTEPRSYVDFEPRIERCKGKDGDTIIVDVSGFQKEHLKVLINTGGSLKISGERLIGGLHWSRFSRSFDVPNNCNFKGIQAKFDRAEELLYVILPFSVPPSDLTPPLLTQGQEAASNGKKEASEDSTATLQTGRKGCSVPSVFNKRRLFTLSVILGVLISLGLAIYLSYMFNGLQRK